MRVIYCIYFMLITPLTLVHHLLNLLAYMCKDKMQY